MAKCAPTRPSIQASSEVRQTLAETLPKSCRQFELKFSQFQRVLAKLWQSSAKVGPNRPMSATSGRCWTILASEVKHRPTFCQLTDVRRMLAGLGPNLANLTKLARCRLGFGRIGPTTADFGLSPTPRKTTRRSRSTCWWARGMPWPSLGSGALARRPLSPMYLSVQRDSYNSAPASPSCPVLGATRTRDECAGSGHQTRMWTRRAGPISAQNLAFSPSLSGSTPVARVVATLECVTLMPCWASLNLSLRS